MTNREMLERLVISGKRFRATPIVDDDFVAIKNEFDDMLAEADRHLNNPQAMCMLIVDGFIGPDEVLVTDDE